MAEVEAIVMEPFSVKLVEDALLDETFASPRFVPDAFKKVNCKALACSEPPIVRFCVEETLPIWSTVK